MEPLDKQSHWLQVLDPLSEYQAFSIFQYIDVNGTIHLVRTAELGIDPANSDAYA